jgi:hypothetical protein
MPLDREEIKKVLTKLTKILDLRLEAMRQAILTNSLIK